MSVLITGNTYPVKDRLRALGGTWDAQAKGWRVPEDKADEARKIVANASSGARKSGARTGRSGRCRGCGGPIRNAPHARAQGGYCGSCAFDEYDC